MTKKKIIIISIITMVLLLNIILFGFVFRLRKQKVTIVGEEIAYTGEQIIEVAGLENGKSIFLLDKDKAICNLENEFANLKVIQIKTNSITEIEFRVRKRYETYYVKNLGLYYVLDEDLKVLDVKEDVSEVGNLIEISELSGVNENLEKSKFVGNSIQKNLCYNLYTAVYTTQIKDEVGEQAHIKMCEMVDKISFDKGYTASGGSYERLIIKTKQGMTFDIGRANQDLQRKINICFEVLNSDQVVDKQNSNFVISYDKDGNELRNVYQN